MYVWILITVYAVKYEPQNHLVLDATLYIRRHLSLWASWGVSSTYDLDIHVRQDITQQDRYNTGLFLHNIDAILHLTVLNEMTFGIDHI